MTLTEQVAKNIIRKLLKGEDYRIEIEDDLYLTLTIKFNNVSVDLMVLLSSTLPIYRSQFVKIKWRKNSDFLE